MSDASGTLWMDIMNRQWSEQLLEISKLNTNHMPKLVEGIKKLVCSLLN